MRTPAGLTCIRHGESTLNAWHDQLHSDPLYKQFIAGYDKDPESAQTLFSAQRLKDSYGSLVADHKSSLTFLGRKQARATAYALESRGVLPDVIYVSPYRRTMQTLEQMQKVWTDLRNVPVETELKIREQEIGEVALYGDFKLFFALNPSQREVFEMDDLFYYRFPNGENIPDVMQRLEMWIRNISEQHAGKRVMMISHFTAILSLRALLERWDNETFRSVQKTTRGINCGLTRYDNKYGKLQLVSFNQKLW